MIKIQQIREIAKEKGVKAGKTGKTDLIRSMEASGKTGKENDN